MAETRQKLQWVSVGALMLLAPLLAAGNIWETVSRSLIPYRLDGRVSAIDMVSEPHSDDGTMWLVTVGTQRRVVDPHVARLLRVGDTVHKAAWSARLLTPRGAVQLSLSRDAHRMFVVMPAVLLTVVGVALVGRPRRASRRVSAASAGLRGDRDARAQAAIGPAGIESPSEGCRVGTSASRL
jgi:hypothetical protein